MALIKCPECGKEISDKAISCPNCGVPIQGQTLTGAIDSGTETFSITEKNRLSLTASADAEINTRTARLSQQGKNVVNVQRSEPQPFTMGVTVWKMDIILVWNASLDNPTYKEYLYNQAITLHQNGKYDDASTILKKIPNYKDSQSLLTQSESKYHEQQQLVSSVGKDPRSSRKSIWIFAITLFIFGLLVIWLENNLTGYLEGAPIGTTLIVIGIACAIIGEIVINIRSKSYDERLSEYNMKQHNSRESLTNTTSKPTTLSNSQTTVTDSWTCKYCATQNRKEALYCKNCGEYKES